MGFLERFTTIWGAVWSCLWNFFGGFLGLREGHLGQSWAIVRRCDLHMRNDDSTCILNILTVTLGGFRFCDFINI